MVGKRLIIYGRYSTCSISAMMAYTASRADTGGACALRSNRAVWAGGGSW